MLFPARNSTARVISLPTDSAVFDCPRPPNSLYLSWF